MFCKIEVLNKSTKFAGKKTVPESLLNKFAGLHACNFNKKRLQHRCFLFFGKCFETFMNSLSRGRLWSSASILRGSKKPFSSSKFRKIYFFTLFLLFFFSFLHVILWCKIISWFWNQKLWFQVHVIASIHCVKVSKYGVISGPYFPVFSPNTEKYGPEITPYMDTFHVVLCVNMN